MMYPRQTSITRLIYQLRQMIFPEHFGKCRSSIQVREVLKNQIEVSLLHRKQPILENVGEAASIGNSVKN